MEDKIEVPSGYGSVYPNSYWGGVPKEIITEVIEVVTTPEPIEKQTIFNKIISIFK